MLLGVPDKAGNVHNLQEGGHLALGLVQTAEPPEAIVWDVDTSLFTQVIPFIRGTCASGYMCDHHQNILH